MLCKVAERAGGACAQGERAHSILPGTEHPAKDNHCTWIPQSLHPPSPPQPQIKPGMFIDLNTAPTRGWAIHEDGTSLAGSAWVLENFHSSGSLVSGGAPYPLPRIPLSSLFIPAVPEEDKEIRHLCDCIVPHLIA